MLDVPGHEVLDKRRLIGGCARLPVAVDADRLQREVQSLPAERWAQRVGRHQAAQVVYLRGQAPAAGDLPIEDADDLGRMPYVRELVHQTFGAPPMRALLARLPAQGAIIPHKDQGPYFAKTLRLHFPVVTTPQVWTYCAGLSYHFRAGEAWALNNSAVHGVWNGDRDAARIHLICDFLPAAPLLALLARADRGLGVDEPAVQRALAASLETSPG